MIQLIGVASGQIFFGSEAVCPKKVCRLIEENREEDERLESEEPR